MKFWATEKYILSPNFKEIIPSSVERTTHQTPAGCLGKNSSGRMETLIPNSAKEIGNS